MSKTNRELKEEWEDCDPKDDSTHEAFSIKPHGIQHNEAYDKCMNIVESIQSERENDYGDAVKSHDNIAEMWTAYLQRRFGSFVNIDRTDVAVMMMLMKASRFAYQRKHDSVLDMASYADFALQFMDEHETKANTR